MRAIVRRWLAGMGVLLMWPAAVAQEPVTFIDLFELCVRQPRVFLTVDVDTDTVQAGVTQERVKNVVMSRLRAARMNSSSGSGAFLSVVVHSMPTRDGWREHVAASLSFALVKPVQDYRDTGERWMGDTWNSDSLLLANGDFLMQAISEETDNFVREFLRVNESEECRAALRENAPDLQPVE